MLDLTTEAGRAVARRFETELVAWLTTVSPSGQPQTSAVWFLWQDGELLLYSLAATPRVRNIEANPQVAMNLNSDPTAEDVVTLEGEARIDPTAPLASGVPAWIAKYGDLIAGYGWSVDWYANRYPTAIRVRPKRFRFG